MFRFIEKLFIELLSICTIGNLGDSLASNSREHLKCMYLNNQTCQARPTLVDINSNQKLLLSFYC